MNQAPKRRWRRVDGVLLLDKPGGMSSNDALQKARRLFSAEKGGHTGTLDPLATGLLPLCFGEATKFSADLLNADKTYEAELRLGITTRTGDAEGEVIEERPVAVDEAAFAAVLPRFMGEQLQVPPMYSALKKDGRPLYELARQGIEVERAARTITIHVLDLLSFAAPVARIRVRCSKGTYIRTLAEDIGKALGCGAHLTALRRTGVADLQLPRALTLAEIEACPEGERDALLLPVDALLQGLPVVELDEAGHARFANGNPVSYPQAGLLGPCRVYAGQALLGLGRADADGKLHPQRLVARAEG
ncbi:MAG: tRNA pseudouridine(55) synthase TruB [Rhodocyclaceae bacterium]|nr:tRNA pseudouridine(55) synthase TruB [Rhodocyclaceae bacterium]